MDQRKLPIIVKILEEAGNVADLAQWPPDVMTQTVYFGVQCPYIGVNTLHRSISGLSTAFKALCLECSEFCLQCLLLSLVRLRVNAFQVGQEYAGNVL